MIKTYVLDTNVLLHIPESLRSFEDNNVILPMAVIEELDHFKSRLQIDHTDEWSSKKGLNAIDVGVKEAEGSADL